MKRLAVGLVVMHAINGIGCGAVLRYLLKQPVRGAHPTGAIAALCALPLLVGCGTSVVCMGLAAYSTARWSLALQLFFSLIPILGLAMNSDKGPKVPGYICLLCSFALLIALVAPS